MEYVEIPFSHHDSGFQ